MTDHHQDQPLTERMEHAAALPPEHPVRYALTVELARADAETQRQWLDLLRDDERLRLNMHRVDAPASLSNALEEIPDQAPTAGRIGWSILRRASLALAAAVLLAVGLTITVNVPDWTFDHTTRRIAAAAMTTHTVRPQLTVQTASSEQLVERFNEHLHFKPRLPAMEGFTLVGGAISQIEGRPVLLSRWTRDGRSYSLYQFCNKDFDLSNDFDRTILCPFAGEKPGDPCRVILWTEGHCAYALADETGEYAAQLQSRSANAAI